MLKCLCVSLAYLSKLNTDNDICLFVMWCLKFDNNDQLLNQGFLSAVIDRPRQTK